MYGIPPRLGKVRNEYTRGIIRVRDIADKLQERRLRWYGYTRRKPLDYFVNAMMSHKPWVKKTK